MNNPDRILRTLDSFLGERVELTLFGRAALALGFKDVPAEFEMTHDVDAILSLEWLAAPDENVEFWQAQQKTNAALESDGLYITHLFRETEVILRPDWLSDRIRIEANFNRLAIYRPSSIDLILTKMARGDANDLNDISFILRGDKSIDAGELQRAFAQARVPNVAEIQELFAAAQTKVLALAG